MKNVYVHFPFCRSKCSYCALRSSPGSSPEERENHVRKVAAALRGQARLPDGQTLGTLYFGGGSPALCDLKPLKEALSPLVGPQTEFTVELHPLDVTDAKLDELESIGVNRVSMGVQSLDDATLKAMGRGYTANRAQEAFARIAERFPNSGIDLIVGYPGDKSDYAGLKDWPLKHVSVYSLILEPGTRLAKSGVEIPDDDETMDRLASAAGVLKSLGFTRYEISNYAKPGFECRHNLAVWFGEDYLGIGEGAHGRIGLKRTEPGREYSVDEKTDRIERAIFRLRTRYGLDSTGFPEWRETLDGFAASGLLERDGGVYTLTGRGTEVCDSILTELV